MQRNYQGKYKKTIGRIIAINFIKIYQFILSPFIGQHCRHVPSCSEYAYEAIARHGLWAGGWLTLFRIISCNPFGSHGWHPVIEKLPKNCYWFMPWKYYQLVRKHKENLE
ncbi:membrane protein insertion efficiency factor YidD [Bartonella sp. DGB1]|uniref:membrane protein insertion efficiency factor YidD n=1 Tax=Bartonella sp. DGB1 TaxID=3239807 RepID=UPI003525D2E2